MNFSISLKVYDKLIFYTLILLDTAIVQSMFSTRDTFKVQPTPKMSWILNMCQLMDNVQWNKGIKNQFYVHVHERFNQILPIT
jgi:hypothetical protein